MILAFGDFELDEASGDLRRMGVEVALQPLPLRVLLHLVRHRHRVVPREELLDTVWAGVTVSDAALSSAIRDVRHALGDTGSEQRILHTLRKRGFHFASPVTEVRGVDPTSQTVRSRRGTFVGRGGLLAELERAREAAGAGHGCVVLLAGEAGIGKTRTARYAAEVARRHGFQVLEGWYPESQDAPPYWGWVRILRTLADGEDDAALRAELGAEAPLVAQLLPELADRLPDRVPRARASPARLALFDAIARFLARACERRPRMLLLDDLHWADRGSLGLLEHVARAATFARILMVATYRDAAVDAEHPLSETLATLARLDHYRRHRLAGLSREETRVLARVVSARSLDDRIEATLWDRTGGNPFYVGELVRYLCEEGPGGSSSARQSAIPAAVRDVVTARLARLTRACRRTLRVAAVIGEHFDRELLVRASGCSGDEIAADLVAAHRAELAAPDESDGRTWHFHGLVLEALRARLGGSARALHARVAAALDGLDDLDEDVRASARAHHLYEALPEVDARSAREALEAAAVRADRQRAYHEAASLYERALRVVEHEPDSAAHRLRLLLGHASSLWCGNEALEEATRLFLEAAALARRLGDAEAFARAAFGAAGAGGYVGGIVSEPSSWMPLGEEALALLGPAASPLRALLLARLAQVGCATADPAVPEQRARKALAMARRLGHDEALAAALYSCHLTAWRPGQERARLALLEEMIRVADRSGDWEFPIEARLQRAGELLVVGDLVGSEAEIRAVSRLADEGKLPFYRCMALVARGMQALREGRFAAIRPLHEEISAFEFGNPGVAIFRSGQAALAAALQRIPAKKKLVQPKQEAAVAAVPPSAMASPVRRVFLAWLASQRGDAPTARRELAWLSIDGFVRLPRISYSFAGTAAMLAEVAARLDDSSRAAWLYDALHPMEGSNVVFPSVYYLGSVSRYLALLARCLGRPAVAARHFEAALECDARMQAHPWLALARCDFAELLTEHHEAAHARRLAEQAEQAAARMEMRPLLERARSLLARGDRSAKSPKQFPA